MQLFLTAFESVPDPRAEKRPPRSHRDPADRFPGRAVRGAALLGNGGVRTRNSSSSSASRSSGTVCLPRTRSPWCSACSIRRRSNAAFGRLTTTLVAALAKGGVIAIDGKSLKGAYEKGEKSSPRMMVSAYAAGLRLTLATVAAKNGDEVDAALEVIGLIDLKGKIVTGDALHCNRRMVEAIVEKGGEYCIALKGKKESLLSDARACLAKADEPKAKKQHPVAKTETSGHGRVETRTGIVVDAKGLAEYHEFPGLKAFGRIEATRVIDGKTETEARIFVLSRKLSPKALLETARDHWQIENALHWQLDVSFGEDAARNRKDNGPANIATSAAAR
jgi:predicted transposase YbfD/YdcC